MHTDDGVELINDSEGIALFRAKKTSISNIWFAKISPLPSSTCYFLAQAPSSKMVVGKMQLPLFPVSPSTSRRFAFGTRQCLPGRRKPEVLRPDIAGVRGSMVKRLRPRVTVSTPLPLSNRGHDPSSPREYFFTGRENASKQELTAAAWLSLPCAPPSQPGLPFARCIPPARPARQRERKEKARRRGSKGMSERARQRDSKDMTERKRGTAIERWQEHERERERGREERR